MNTALSHISHYTPAVFAVQDSYQILLPVHTACTFWVRVGEEEFYDDSNGILRSATDVHCVTVPMEALDRTGCYTVLWQIVEDRKPYFSVLKDAEEQTFAFRPLPGDGIRIYQIADAHGHGDLAAGAAEFYLQEKGGLDLLILNGDIVDHSGCAENFLIYYELAAALTKGEIPIIVSRGNHDLRGVAAEKLEDYMPSDNGKSYFSFRLGSLWGIVLDCAEDKDDANPEYGNTNRCYAFRLRENEAFRQIVSHAEDEYAADGNPFEVNSRGEIIGVTVNGRKLSDAEHPLCSFRYEVFSEEDYNRFLSRYNRLCRRGEKPLEWMVEDFSKIGMASGNTEHRSYQPRCTHVAYDGKRMVVDCEMPEEASGQFGCPRSIQYEAQVRGNRLLIDFAWFDKDKNRIAEAMWLTFHPIVAAPTAWRIEKLGQMINPFNHAPLGGVQHYTNGMVHNQDLIFHMNDGALVTFGKPNFLEFDHFMQDGSMLSLNLYNNIWGTNFPMWYNENGRIRVEIEIADADSNGVKA